MAKHPAVGFIEEALRHLTNDHCAGQVAVKELVKALEYARTTRPPTESENVLEFMMKFGHVFTTGQGTPLHLTDSLNRPRHLTNRLLIERREKMLEELGEFDTAAEAQDLAKMADALIDLVYFAKGTAVLLGLPWEELWDDVHRANMAKERGAKMRQGHLHKVDAVKPEGWIPPTTEHILAVAGYDGQTGVQWDHPEYCPGGPQEQKKEWRAPAVKTAVDDELAEACIGGSGIDNGGKP
jgi:hypothetical protein